MIVSNKGNRQAQALIGWACFLHLDINEYVSCGQAVASMKSYILIMAVTLTAVHLLIKIS